MWPSFAPASAVPSLTLLSPTPTENADSKDAYGGIEAKRADWVGRRQTCRAHLAQGQVAAAPEH